MKRICLSKYGFVKWPEESFSDDGNYFEGWRAGEAARVSKHVSNGQAYLSCRVKGSLPYEIYSELPHYRRAIWDFNGVSAESLTDALLQDFFNSCVAYEKEYRAAEASIEYPTLEELTDKTYKVVSKKIFELQELKELVAKHVATAAMLFSEYEWKRIRDCIRHLNAEIVKFDPTTYPSQIYKTGASLDFIKADYEGVDSYWFKSIKEVFDNYKLV